MADTGIGFINECDVTGTFNGVEFEAYAEREGLSVFKQDYQGNLISDLELRKLWAEVWPLITGDVGTSVILQVGTQEQITDAVSWSDDMEYIIGTSNKVNPLISGRYISIRFKTTHGNAWRVLGYDADVRPLGKY